MSSEGEELKPVEKMRIRVAAEGYQGYKALKENQGDEDHDHKNNNKHDAGSRVHRVCSSYDTIFVVLLILALIIIVSLSVLLAVQGFVKNDKNSKSCQSPECVQTSASILSKMNLDADPCQDFYEYACGTFTRDPQNPPEEPKYSMFTVIGRRNKALIKQLLEEEGSIYDGVNSTAVEKVKRYYSVCMNLTATENTDVTHMMRLIKEVGSWTVTSDDVSGVWSEQDFELETTVAKLHSYGVMALFGFGVSTDLKNNSNMILSFDQSGLTFSDYTHYVGNNTEKYRTAYVEYFSEIAQLLGGVENSLDLAQDVWDFEVKLAKIHDKPDDRVDTNAIYHKMSLHDLENMLDSIGDTLNLAEYMHKMFGKDIDRDEPVVVYSTNFYSNLTNVIKNTTKQTLANYLTFSMVQSMINYMPENFKAPDRKLNKILLGVSEQPAHWLRCVSRSSHVLGFALGALYTDKYFTEQDLHDVNSLLDEIISEFGSSLAQVTWMDKKTRNVATRKLDVMNRKIGYPDFIKHADKLDEHYEALIVKDTNSFENALLARKFGVEEDLKKYGEPPDKNKWSMYPTEVNAYYSQTQNEMVFPAGILADPFFSSAFSAAINYGSMGFIMGHELTHGFDNKGRLFDKEGNLQNWWTEESSQKFDEKTKCLIDQYSQYKVGDTHLNGLTTLGENIADNGGLKNSFSAYRKWLKKHGYKDENSNLPGLNFTHNQLFFLAFAQTWCTSMTPEYEEAAVITDVHSNARYRVRGVLSNTEDFAEAFQCKTGSNLNPEHKCSVW